IMSKISKRPSVAMPTSKEDKAITAAAKADPDAQPLTAKQLKAMVPMCIVSFRLACVMGADTFAAGRRGVRTAVRSPV
ncbi:MAG TPA: hypothetical protein VHF02_06895, partial [Luteimonas sp.]|nr:hypothetical protein [Luteimonas sp.]